MLPSFIRKNIKRCSQHHNSSMIVVVLRCCSTTVTATAIQPSTRTTTTTRRTFHQQQQQQQQQQKQIQRNRNNNSNKNKNKNNNRTFTTSSSIRSNSYNYSTIRQDAIQRMFRIVNEKYGGSLPFEKKNSLGREILISNQTIQQEHLLRLMKHDALAIHIKDFYSKTDAKNLVQQLVEDNNHSDTKKKKKIQNWNISTNRGLESSDVGTIGEHVPFNIATSSSKAQKVQQQQQQQDEQQQQTNHNPIHDYFHGVQQELQIRRRRPLPPLFDEGGEVGGPIDQTGPSLFTQQQQQQQQLWPLDLLRLQLDEQWPAGAGLARYMNQTIPGRPSLQHDNTNHHNSSTSSIIKNPPFGGGLTRIMKGPTRWAKGYIHVDEMGPLRTRQGLFSANIYLQLPTTQSSGSSVSDDVLHIWPLAIKNRWDWYRNALLLSGLSTQDVLAQQQLRFQLGSPVTIPNVQVGDCILFCVQRPHCAIGFDTGTRVSLQCFIQHQGDKERLLIDC